jgi:hypothetical protein
MLDLGPWNGGGGVLLTRSRHRWQWLASRPGTSWSKRGLNRKTEEVAIYVIGQVVKGIGEGKYAHGRITCGRSMRC